MKAWLATAALAIAATGHCAMPTPAVDGAQLYEKKCAICHATGAPGTAALARRLPAGVPALLAERTDLPPLLVATVVRNGIGGMQRFTRIELTDGQLQAITEYLTRTR